MSGTIKWMSKNTSIPMSIDSIYSKLKRIPDEEMNILVQFIGANTQKIMIGIHSWSSGPISRFENGWYIVLVGKDSIDNGIAYVESEIVKEIVKLINNDKYNAIHDKLFAHNSCTTNVDMVGAMLSYSKSCGEFLMSQLMLQAIYLLYYGQLLLGIDGRLDALLRKMNKTTPKPLLPLDLEDNDDNNEDDDSSNGEDGDGNNEHTYIEDGNNSGDLDKYTGDISSVKPYKNIGHTLEPNVHSEMLEDFQKMCGFPYDIEATLKTNPSSIKMSEVYMNNTNIFIQKAAIHFITLCV